MHPVLPRANATLRSTRPRRHRCSRVRLNSAEYPSRAMPPSVGSAGIEVDGHRQRARAHGTGGPQTEPAPAVAATEDADPLLGVIVVEDARRSGPPPGAR